MPFSDYTFATRDEFKRKPIASSIIKLLRSPDINISPLIIDGDWGTGKTEFCLKLINEMSPLYSHHLIYIDAFKADHADEPLITILAKIMKHTVSEEKQPDLLSKIRPALRYGFKTLLKAGASHVLRQDVTAIVDDFDKEIKQAADETINASIDALLKDHIEADKNLKTFQDALTDIAREKPIVLFIDELDRCRPNFAVKMLEVIKHTFDIPYVQFVLITNTNQLKAAINHCYGQTIDAHRYLDKFQKLTLTLPTEVSERDTRASYVHFKQLVGTKDILKDKGLTEYLIAELIRDCIKDQSLSLREIESLVRHLEIYMTLNTHFNSENIAHSLLQILGVFLVCLKPQIAKDILEGKGNAKDIGNFLTVPELPTTLERPKPNELLMAFLGQELLQDSEPYIVNKHIRSEWHEIILRYYSGGSWPYEVGKSKAILIRAIQVINLIKT